MLLCNIHYLELYYINLRNLKSLLLLLLSKINQTNILYSE